MRVFIFWSLLLGISFIISCGNSENPGIDEIEIILEDFSASVSENPFNGQSIGDVVVATNRGNLVFELMDVVPEGAITIDINQGTILVNDSSVFDFEENQSVTATIRAINDTVVVQSNLDIEILNISEVFISPFQVTIPENPVVGQVLGLITSTTESGTVTYSITQEILEGTFSIDANTGELSVQDSLLFDFEAFTSLQATISAQNQESFDEGVVTINLTDQDDPSSLFFEKVPFGSPSMEVNQDRITENVWITRGENSGIYNIRQEEGFIRSVSPEGTEWALGTTRVLNDLSFSNWLDIVNEMPPNSVGQDFVVHLIEEDIFIDLRMVSWTQGRTNGGGFSYRRTNP